MLRKRLENKMNIFKLIPKVMSDLGAIGKSGNNSQQGYKFRKIDDVYNSLMPVLAKHGVFFVPSVLESHEERFTTSKGTSQIRVKLKVKYNVYADDGSSFETVVEGEGIDTSDKATNKALTASFKYMLIQVLCIAVEDIVDADSDSPESPAPRAAAQKPKAKSAPTTTDFANYIVDFGKYKGQSLSSIDASELMDYVTYIETKAKSDRKEITGKVLEFVTNACAYAETKMESPAAMQLDELERAGL